MSGGVVLPPHRNDARSEDRPQWIISVWQRGAFLLLYCVGRRYLMLATIIASIDNGFIDILIWRDFFVVSKSSIKSFIICFTQSSNW